MRAWFTLETHFQRLRLEILFKIAHLYFCAIALPVRPSTDAPTVTFDFIGRCDLVC